VSTRVWIKDGRMKTTDVTPLQQMRVPDPPSGDDAATVAASPPALGAEGPFVLGELVPIWPLMVIVAIATLAFTPFFALVAIVALTGAIFAVPLLLIHHILRRG
jgi:hypothetical protein